MSVSIHRMRRVCAAALIAASALTSIAYADPRSDTFIRLLTTSSEFRVRTQAALSLGRTDGGDDVVRALVRALEDSHPAVRAAAATALGTVGDSDALPALRRVASDRDASVRTAVSRAEQAIGARASGGGTTSVPAVTGTAPAGQARYYVGVGTPGTRVSRIGQDMTAYARSVLVQQLARVGGVEVAPEHESNAAAQQVIARRRLAGAYIDCSIVSADTTAAGTRVAVSVIVGTYPGRDMRAILQGAATVPGAGGPEADRMAIEGAIRGALRNLPQALTQAAGGR